MSWLPRLDYLDLASRYPSRQIITTDNNPHLCYFRTRSVLHSTHSESPHLNSLTDLLLSIGVNSDKQLNDSLTLLEAVKLELQQQNQLLKDLNQNIEYLKNSQEALNSKVRGTNFLSLPQRRDVLRLANLIEDNKPRDFEIAHKDLLVQVQKLVIGTEEQLNLQISGLQTLVIKTEEQINLQISGVLKTLEELKYK